MKVRWLTHVKNAKRPTKCRTKTFKQPIAVCNSSLFLLTIYASLTTTQHTIFALFLFLFFLYNSSSSNLCVCVSLAFLVCGQTFIVCFFFSRSSCLLFAFLRATFFLLFSFRLNFLRFEPQIKWRKKLTICLCVYVDSVSKCHKSRVWLHSDCVCVFNLLYWCVY